jgi:hypothetical protein
MRSTAILAACLTAALLTGCGTSGAGTKAGCEWVKPIYVSRTDALTDGTARQILAHNESWKAVCG